MSKIIHLSRDGKTLACGTQIAFAPEWPSAASGADWRAVTCSNCKNTTEWKQLSGHPNPRGAGRKPTGIVKTHQQVTVYRDDYDTYANLPNKSKFVRDAIAEKLKRESLS